MLTILDPASTEICTINYCQFTEPAAVYSFLNTNSNLHKYTLVSKLFVHLNHVHVYQHKLRAHD